MAYNTRRTGPQGMGRGTPPMMYQQQRTNTRTPPAFGNARNTNSSPTTPNNYQGNVTQQPVANNSNFTPQHQTQQQQKHVLQKQEPQTPPPPVKPELRPKEEPMTPLSGTLAPPPPPPPTLMETSPVAENVEGKEEQNGESKGKTWIKKKLPSFKINKKVKRRRQNARLRKILQPKNAIMVLNELKSGIKFSFQDSLNSNFMVTAEIEGKTFTGQGMSKPLAKQEAAENALKDLLLQKMSEAALKVASIETETTEPMVTDTASSVGDTDSVDGATESGKPMAAEDEVPWGSLASFALYKLFTDWQSQGTHVHISKVPAFSPGQSPKPTAPHPMKKIPDNPTERHPVMLLNQLKPGAEFKEISREGTPPNLIFTLSVTVDGVSYTGVAKNKKDAKKEAAKAALAGSFNIKYD